MDDKAIQEINKIEDRVIALEYAFRILVARLHDLDLMHRDDLAMNLSVVSLGLRDQSLHEPYWTGNSLTPVAVHLENLRDSLMSLELTNWECKSE